jgi:excisionase family DNA binding protein
VSQVLRNVASRWLAKDPGEQGPFCLSIGTSFMQRSVETGMPWQEWLKGGGGTIEGYHRTGWQTVVQQLPRRLGGLRVRNRQERLVRATEAAAYLGVSLVTLRRMEKQGLLSPYRTLGGHRRYSIQMLEEYLEGSRRLPPAGEH